MSSQVNKRTFLCLNQQNREVYITYYPDSNKWQEREIPASERLISPSLIASPYRLRDKGDLIFSATKRSSSRRGYNSSEIYIYQTVTSLKIQIDSLYRLIQSGAAQWFKTALVIAIEKAILLKCRTGELVLIPEVEKQFSVFQKCVALLSTDKVGEMEAAFNKAVIIGMKLVNK